jgi:osmoprotectant transport system substrate-binding protein
LFPKSVRVGSKNTPEQILLGEIVAQYLEKKTETKVIRRLGLGDANVVVQAAVSRDLDIFPEDTGTAISMVIKENAIMDPVALLERVRAEYDRMYGLQWSNPLGATNRTVMVVTQKLAAKDNLTDLSSASSSKTPWRFGVTPEFASSKDGLTSFSTAYRMLQQAPPRNLEAAALYQALIDGQVNLISGTETDGLLTDATFKGLIDDKRIFPPSQVCLVMRRDAIQNVEGLEKAVSQLTGKITTEELRRMNRDIEISKRTAAEVAKEFLTKTGLL